MSGHMLMKLRSHDRLVAHTTIETSLAPRHYTHRRALVRCVTQLHCLCNNSTGKKSRVRASDTTGRLSCRAGESTGNSLI